MVVYGERIINGKLCRVARSNIGLRIERAGRRYDEAADPIGSDRTYEETDTPVDEEVAEEDKDAALRRFGVEV